MLGLATSSLTPYTFHKETEGPLFLWSAQAYLSTSWFLVSGQEPGKNRHSQSNYSCLPILSWLIIRWFQYPTYSLSRKSYLLTSSQGYLLPLKTHGTWYVIAQKHLENIRRWCNGKSQSVQFLYTIDDNEIGKGKVYWLSKEQITFSGLTKLRQEMTYLPYDLLCRLRPISLESV